MYVGSGIYTFSCFLVVLQWSVEITFQNKKMHFSYLYSYLLKLLKLKIIGKSIVFLVLAIQLAPTLELINNELFMSDEIKKILSNPTWPLLARWFIKNLILILNYIR